jgi:hypothetical protein
MKIRQADAVRAGAEACAMEIFGTVRPLDFFTETVSDSSYGHYLHKMAQAKTKGR